MALSALIRGMRSCNDTVKVRLPIKTKLLEMLLFEVDRHFGQKGQLYLAVLYQTIFALAYYGMMGVGEISTSDHTLKACNVHVGCNKKKILLVLYSSKTHSKESRPLNIKISAVEQHMKQERFFCPFDLTRSYLRLRGSYVD